MAFYLTSQKVKVFPSAYRGKNSEDKVYDPESRLNSEKNLTGLVNRLSSRDSYAIKIEIHHYPFSLYDIVRIVYKKRCYFNEPMNVELVAKECTMLHYQLLVGLIPLSSTAHQLFHAGKVDKKMDFQF